MLFLENVSIKISLTTTGKKPLKSYADSAGFDLYADETVLVLPKNQSWVSIGLRMQIPLGCCGKIYSRSGLADKYKIIAFNGIVDPGFLGVVKVLLFNLSDQEYYVKKGTRIAQMIFSKTENVCFKIQSLDFESKRNNKGFGSSGVW